MINRFDHYLSDLRWQIYGRAWAPELQTVRETQLALGNGYIGSRAVLEEIPKGSEPGTFFAGLYDKTAAHVTELVNAPNPIDLRIIAEGEKLDVSAMDVRNHERILDMQYGLLVRRTVFSNARKKRFDYQSLRFFSMHNKHLAVMQIYLTPLDETAHFTVETTVDISVTNKGLITEGDKKHIHIVEVQKVGNVNYLCTKTLEKEILIAYASETQVQILGRTKIKSVPYRTFYRTVKKGATLCITKFFAFYTSREINPKRIKVKSAATVRRAVQKGFDKLVKEHKRAWVEKWQKANIEINGDFDRERAVRFNIYHLLILGNEKDDDVSLGARGLSGEAYRGHVFWDTEIFMLPFFIYTSPEIARNLLLYRYHRLDAARQIAQAKGYRGVMFPWESADSGEETTPGWFKDINGNVREVVTMTQEHHITADIAYTVFHYFLATNDVDFMLEYGLEIMLATARFWASRVEYNQRRKRYEIKHIMGPDEYHGNVNNNAYTNAMAQWHLLTAYKIYRVLRRDHSSRVRKLIKRINLKTSEPAQWNRIARKIFIPINKKTGIIESFEGYFKRKKLPLPELNTYSLPTHPRQVRDLTKTQFIKQADVVMLLYLLADNFTPEQRKKNYLYYYDRTLHKSSLSPAPHALVGARVGETNKAYRYFLATAYIDLKNAYGNTQDGIHSAALGGTWQAMINGFAGVHIKKGILSFDPNLPNHWKGIKFPLKWKGFDLSINIGRESLNLYFKSRRKRDWIPVRTYGLLHKLPANKTTTFSVNKE